MTSAGAVDAEARVAAVLGGADGPVVDAGWLAARYRLIERIGHGRMAEVWRAEDAALGRQVAVKLWCSREVGGDGAVEGIWREVRDATRLAHPNVARVYDVGADGDLVFLITELVTGQDLATLLARHGPLPIAKVAEVGAQVARVLAAAHAEGIVHRGVKPANLLVTSDGTVKLTDFGIAAFAEGVHGSGAGSAAAYVSPEQAVGEPAGPASDVYALGCVLYEMLVGRSPFSYRGDDPTDPEPVLRRHVKDEPRPPGQLRPDIPAELENIVLRMLAKSPTGRPAGADRVAQILQAIEAIQSITED